MQPANRFILVGCICLTYKRLKCYLYIRRNETKQSDYVIKPFAKVCCWAVTIVAQSSLAETILAFGCVHTSLTLYSFTHHFLNSQPKFRKSFEKDVGNRWKGLRNKMVTRYVNWYLDRKLVKAQLVWTQPYKAVFTFIVTMWLKHAKTHWLKLNKSQIRYIKAKVARQRQTYAWWTGI